MSVDLPRSESDPQKTDSHRPSAALFTFLENEIRFAEEFETNLKRDYAVSVYEKFERQFTALRKRFKEKIQLRSDADYAFLTRSESRRQAVEKIVTRATLVAERFQEARENKRLDYSRSTDALEDLINAIKDLKEQSQGVR